jgi:hypothetical protein
MASCARNWIAVGALAACGLSCRVLLIADTPAAKITRLDAYTREKQKTGEGAGQWCGDPQRPGTALGATEVTTPERMFLMHAGKGASASVTSQNVLVQRSVDSGTTWTQTLRSSELGYAIDPTCAFGTGGKAYVAAMGWRNDEMRGVNLWHSEDRGATWSGPLFTDYPEFYDRPFLGVDSSASRYAGSIYLAAATMVLPDWGQKNDYARTTPGRIVVMRSSDGGRTLSRPVHVETGVGLGNGAIHMGQIGTFSDGTVLVSWSEGEIPSIGLGGMFDGVKAAAGVPEGFRFAVAVARSRDGARSFSPEQRVAISESAQIVNGQTIESGKWYPALAIDATHGKYSDRAYMVWNEMKDDRSRIAFTRSQDRGEHWDEVRAVGEKPPFVAADNGAGPHQVMPSVAVNREGVIGVSYYESSPVAEDSQLWPTFIYSRDGGDTWSDPVVAGDALTTKHIVEWTKGNGFGNLVPGHEIPPERPVIGFFPTCRWSLMADASGDFLMFPLTSTDDLATTAVVRLHLLPLSPR